MNEQKKSGTAVPSDVPVRRVNLGPTGKPNENALSEEDKEVLSNFVVPLGKGGQQTTLSPDEQRRLSRESALARAREVKRQKTQSRTNANTDTQSAVKQEANTEGMDIGNDDEHFDEPQPEIYSPLVQSSPPPAPVERNGAGVPSLISPARKRRILQMLSDMSDDETEPEERPPTKKSKTTNENNTLSPWQTFVADKTLDFGKFVAATAITGIIVGTLQTFSGNDNQKMYASGLNKDWTR